MTRLRGRAPSGERAVEHAPHGHWHTMTMVSAIRLTGIEQALFLCSGRSALFSE